MNDFFKPHIPDDDSTVYHVGISGGKDSTAALLWLVHESGVPKHRINATFCLFGILTVSWLRRRFGLRSFPRPSAFRAVSLGRFRLGLTFRLATFCADLSEILGDGVHISIPFARHSVSRARGVVRARLAWVKIFHGRSSA